MRAAMERREAPGLLARARAPRDPHLPPKTWVPEAWRVAGFRTPGQGGLAHLLGASRRSIPLLWRGEENRETGVRKTKPQHSGALAETCWLELVGSNLELLKLSPWLARDRRRPKRSCPMPEAIDLLKTRRSVKPVELSGPGPT